MPGTRGWISSDQACAVPVVSSPTPRESASVCVAHGAGGRRRVVLVCFGRAKKKELRLAHRGGSIRALPTISAERSTGQPTRSSSVNSPAATPPSTIAAVRRPLAFPPTPRVRADLAPSPRCALRSMSWHSGYNSEHGLPPGISHELYLSPAPPWASPNANPNLTLTLTLRRRRVAHVA